MTPEALKEANRLEREIRILELHLGESQRYITYNPDGSLSESTVTILIEFFDHETYQKKVNEAISQRRAKIESL